jgi:hypothetical protein
VVTTGDTNPRLAALTNGTGTRKFPVVTTGAPALDTLAPGDTVLPARSVLMNPTGAAAAGQGVAMVAGQGGGVWAYNDDGSGAGALQINTPGVVQSVDGQVMGIGAISLDSADGFVTGQCQVGNGGTSADLSGTGPGIVIQTGAGSALTVRQLTLALLVNNVSAGGSANTLTDWTNLTTYSADAAAIRNAVFQLGEYCKLLWGLLRALKAIP